MKVSNFFRRNVIPDQPEIMCRVLVCELPGGSIVVGDQELVIEPNVFMAYHVAEAVTDEQVVRIDQVLDQMLHRKVFALAAEQLEISMKLALRPA